MGHFNHGFSHMTRIVITSTQELHYFIVYFMFSCYMIYVKNLEIKSSSLVNKKTKNNLRKGMFLFLFITCVLVIVAK